MSNPVFPLLVALVVFGAVIVVQDHELSVLRQQRNRAMLIADESQHAADKAVAVAEKCLATLVVLNPEVLPADASPIIRNPYAPRALPAGWAVGEVIRFEPCTSTMGAACAKEKKQ